VNYDKTRCFDGRTSSRYFGYFKKYDSPLVFKHGSKIYLVGRRNMNKSGYYDTKKGKITDRKKALILFLG